MRTHRGLWLIKLLNIILIAITIVLAIVLLLSYLSTRIDPNGQWWFAFLGLAAPFLFMANAVCLLFWVVRWRIWAIVPSIVLLLGVGYIGDFVQLRFVKVYAEVAPQEGEVTVMSYNVHAFIDFRNKTNYSSKPDSITRYVNQIKADIVCFQEFQIMSAQDSSLLSERMKPWPYQKFSLVVDQPNNKWGLAVYSKYPILDVHPIRFEGQQNSSLWADIALSKKDTMRLFSCHLQTTQFNLVSPDGLRSVYSQDNMGLFIRTVGSTLKQNFKLRAQQVDTISTMIRESPFPTVVVGDFNDTPLSYTYHTMRGDLDDTFCEEGSGYQNTYKPLMGLFRIDYILTSSHFKTTYQNSPTLPWSDHNPVIAKIKLKHNENE
ncbi:MAG: endonuclease/exonuclease/phosphatase family protein [Mucinivorans sp.]